MDRELNVILQTAASELEKGLDSQANVGNITKLLDGVIEKLNVLKRKSEESICDEIFSANVCKKRLEHIKQNVSNASSFHNKMQIDGEDQSNESQIALAAANQWKKIRLNRLIVEHFLRLGYYDTAEILANRSGIRDITNIDIFQVSREVEKDLAQHNTAKCILWCIDNKSKLRKINSDIEFKLKQQEFIELIRKGKKTPTMQTVNSNYCFFFRRTIECSQTCSEILSSFRARSVARNQENNGSACISTQH